MNFMDLTQYYNQLDLITETSLQIIKDFQLAGIKISFSKDTTNPYQELFDSIIPHITTLLERKELNKLLYRIDISERQIFKLIQNDKNNIPEAITHLIIRRELQKVVIRNYHKKK